MFRQFFLLIYKCYNIISKAKEEEYHMKEISGLDLKTTDGKLGFCYGEDIFGPSPEIRYLDDIRASLAEPDSDGPEEVYCIAMDVGKECDKEYIISRNLLFGIVTYAKGMIGKGPVRSQGHSHIISPSCGYSTPEVYEIWEGEAIVYMQESGSDDAGNCYAVYAKAGDIVIVPPDWVHTAVNANKEKNMTFGAWCVRDYGFNYEDVRRHHGIAFYPEYEGDTLCWKQNPFYQSGKLIEQNAREYKEFDIQKGIPMYKQFEQEKDIGYRKLYRNR